MNKLRHTDPFDPESATEAIDQYAPATFRLGDDHDELQTEKLPEHALHYGHSPRIQTINALKRKWAIAEIGRLPQPGESIHVVTNARFDLWDWVPAILDLAAPRVATEYFASIWVLNRRNAVELFAEYDKGRIQAIGFITGLYFKKRESAVFATLYEGLKTRGQRFKAALNHSKWFTMLLNDGQAITVETSANFTENGNMEQMVYTSDVGLHQFYADIANGILASAK